MTLAELIAAARLRLDDCSESRMVSDAAWTAYLNEAQDQAATRSLLLFDDTYSLQVAPGVQTYALPSEVLLLVRVTVADTQRPVYHATHGEVHGVAQAYANTTGEPALFFQQEHRIRLYPAPARALTLNLAGYRLPKFALADPDDEPELAEKDHLALVHWACHKAFLSLDVEVFDEKGALRELSLFEQRFGRSRTSNEVRLWREYPGTLRARPQPF